MASEPMKIIVAVDFGTTFSSMAVANSRNLANQHMIDCWEGQGKTSKHIPTVLQYRQEHWGTSSPRVLNKWGFGAAADLDSDEDYVSYELFKLSLYQRLQDTELEARYPSKRPFASSEQCKPLVVDYLSKMKASLLQHLRGALPPSVMNDDLHIEYIVTVPAIWTESDKDITRRCAIEAGMGTNDRIQIIKEPEAAGLYALHVMKNINLHVNDTFVICDAGGGTVDLMSYTVAALGEDPELTEAATGTGGLCGASYLNRAFENWLDQKIVGTPSFAPWKSEIMEKFEDDLKKRFNGRHAEPYTMIIKSLRSNNSFQHLGIRDGKFTIPTSDLTIIFKTVTRKVVSLVRSQIRNTSSPVTTVLLAGGFGKSEYLLKELIKFTREQMPPVTVSRVPEPDTAVVSGALHRGIMRSNPDLPYAVVRRKIPTKSYGILKWDPFDINDTAHDPSRREVDPYTSGFRIQILHWFMKKNVRQNESKPIEVELESRCLDDGNPLRSLALDIYTCEFNPDQLPNHKTRGVKKMMTVTALLDQIPVPSLVRTTGEDNCGYHGVQFNLEVTIGQADLLSFAVKHNGQSYGEKSVGVEFLRY